MVNDIIVGRIPDWTERFPEGERVPEHSEKPETTYYCPASGQDYPVSRKDKFCKGCDYADGCIHGR